MLVLGGVHVSPELVGRSPQLILKTEIGTVVGLTHLSPPNNFSFPCLIINIILSFIGVTTIIRHLNVFHE